MTNIIKALDRNGSTMTFLRRKFPKISEAKITAGILMVEMVPMVQIREYMTITSITQ